MSAKKGFTLVEIIVVTVILAILATVAVPIYTTSIQQGAAIAAQNNLIILYTAEKNYYFINGMYCTATTGSPAPCGDTLANLNTNLATLNQANPTNTNLNIIDNNFSYTCTNPNNDNGATYTCKAINNSDNTFFLTLTNGSLVLPGGTPPLNPSCVGNYCPS